MGFLDDPSVQPFAAQVDEWILAAEAASGVQLTPVAREIVALFIVAPAFEDPSAGSRGDFNAVGAAATGAVRNLLPEIFEEMRELYGVSGRRQARDIITTGDIYHWLTERAGERLAELSWPYSKK